MTITAKTAIITGAAQGVGAAVALRLAKGGVGRLILIDRQDDKLECVSKELMELGAETVCLPLDLTDVVSLKRQVKTVIERVGRIDIVVNAAGTTARGGLDDTDPETLDFIFDLNVRAPFFLMQEAARAMTKGGVIVNITSMLAYGGPPFLLGYSASKAALVALTKGVANALKRDGIRVFGVNLGWTWTPGEHDTQTQVHGLPENWCETVGATQPFGRLLMPEDPAGLIAFLVSADAAMMTGAIIDLDQFVAGTVDDNPGAA